LKKPTKSESEKTDQIRIQTLKKPDPDPIEKPAPTNPMKNKNQFL